MTTWHAHHACISTSHCPYRIMKRIGRPFTDIFLGDWLARILVIMIKSNKLLRYNVYIIRGQISALIILCKDRCMVIYAASTSWRRSCGACIFQQPHPIYTSYFFPTGRPALDDDLNLDSTGSLWRALHDQENGNNLIWSSTRHACRNPAMHDIELQINALL
jgi:hypothetical protein